MCVSVCVCVRERERYWNFLFSFLVHELQQLLVEKTASLSLFLYPHSPSVSPICLTPKLLSSYMFAQVTSSPFMVILALLALLPIF